MATVVSLLTSGTSSGQNTSQVTGTFNPASAGAASGILVFVYAAENTGTSGASSATTLTDSVANRSAGTTFDVKTWTPTNTAADGVTTGYYLKSISAAATNNGSGFVTIATTSSCRKAWAVYYVTGFPSGTTYGLGGSANTFGTGVSSTNPTRVLAFNNVQLDAVTIGFLGVEGNAAPTAPNTNTNGTWTTLQTFQSNSTGLTANGLATHVKIGTYTGSTTPTSITYNPILSAAVDSQIGAIEIIPTIANNPMAAPTVGTITSTTVDLTWVAPWNIWGISNYIIEYRTTAGPGAWIQQSVGSNTLLSATVTGPLTAGTSYDFNLKSVNPYGTSTTGAISSATTSAPAGPTVTTISTTSSAIQPVVSSSVNISVSTITSTVSITSPTVVSGISVTSSTVPTSSSLFGATPVGAVIAFPSSISGLVAYPNLGVFTGLRYFRPSGDTSTGSWTVSPLWSKVDESIYDDSDFITSEALTSGTTSIAKLALTLV